ncbi:MAG TPA: iron ABC transporter permease, partial [Paenarthrobacter sp.]|nr:iron ABC transporter permease [Paenarthrobacter sp.]
MSTLKPAPELAVNGNNSPEHPHQMPTRRMFSPTVFLALALVVMFAVYVLLGSYTVTIPDFFKIVINHL